MTEEEKRTRALAFLEQEQLRLRNSTFADHRTAEQNRVQRRINTRQQFYADFAKQGITFQEFQKAYNDAFQRGREDMLTYRFSFFYAAAAIAYHETFQASPEEVAIFMKSLADAAEGCKGHNELVQRCVMETGADVSFADEEKPPSHSTRKDRAAVDRMQKTGITQRDLEIERDEGYRDGRNEPFFLSSCYAAVAIVLHRMHGCDAAAIEAFLERIAEIVDEEISTDDILERAKHEAGVDVSQMVNPHRKDGIQ